MLCGMYILKRFHTHIPFNENTGQFVGEEDLGGFKSHKIPKAEPPTNHWRSPTLWFPASSREPQTWQAELDKQKALLQEKLRQRQMAEVPRFGKIEG